MVRDMRATASAAEMEALLNGLMDAGLSNSQIATEAGVSRSMIYRIDNHQLSAPPLETYLKLGGAYERVVGRAPPPLKFR